MAKKPTYSSLKLTAELQSTREEARLKLVDRIEKGKIIKERAITSNGDLEDAQRASNKWDDYNVQLLKTLFTTGEHSEEYSSNNNYPIILYREKYFEEEFRDFHDYIDNKIHNIDSIIDRLELIKIAPEVETLKIATNESTNLDKNKIFIVHGHDNEAKLEVARFIEKIGFEPIILHEQASGSKTIIEKIESYSNVGFGIVLYTACDIGAPKNDDKNIKNRARQNVVLEHGFLIGKLCRQNVCALIKGDIETPNDISGVVYTPMNDGGWKLTLAKELKQAGYKVDMNKVIE